MAYLTAGQRDEVLQKLMEDASAQGIWLSSIQKQDLLDAIIATDEWQDDNQLSFNAAIPQQARNVMTTAEKALMFTYVADKRYIEGA